MSLFGMERGDRVRQIAGSQRGRTGEIIENGRERDPEYDTGTIRVRWDAIPPSEGFAESWIKRSAVEKIQPEPEPEPEPVGFDLWAYFDVGGWKLVEPGFDTAADIAGQISDYGPVHRRTKYAIVPHGQRPY